MTRRAVYAGSFDPLTNGHLYMIRAGAELFDELVVTVGVNPDKQTPRKREGDGSPAARDEHGEQQSKRTRRKTDRKTETPNRTQGQQIIKQRRRVLDDDDEMGTDSQTLCRDLRTTKTA